MHYLVDIGVLSPVRDTEWGLLTPISDVLRRRKGYEFLTKLDISMLFYTFALGEEAQKMCTIVTPFGPFKYNKVPMALVNSFSSFWSSQNGRGIKRH